MKFIKLNWWRLPLVLPRTAVMLSGMTLQYIGTVTVFYGNLIPGLQRL